MVNQQYWIHGNLSQMPVGRGSNNIAENVKNAIWDQEVMGQKVDQELAFSHLTTRASWTDVTDKQINGRRNQQTDQ